jgi:hypothetical protein
VRHDGRLLPEHRDRQSRQNVLKILESMTSDRPTHRNAPRDRAPARMTSLSRPRVPTETTIGR